MDQNQERKEDLPGKSQVNMMKRSDMILLATRRDVAAGEMPAILEKVRETAPTAAAKKLRISKVLPVAAAIVLLLGISISAAALISGFGETFDRPPDSGEVEVVSAESENAEVEWKISEVWFDEYNLFIGGSVLTPQPLAADGEYESTCRIRQEGESEELVLSVYIYPNGSTESAFMIRSQVTRDAEGNPIGGGFGGDSAVLQLHFYWLYDISHVPDQMKQGEIYSFHPLDHLVYPGEWIYTVNASSGDQGKVVSSGPYEGENHRGETFRVDAVNLSCFTLEIEGENLVEHYPKQGGRTGEAYYLVWIKMKDGRLMGKSRRAYAYTDNGFMYNIKTPTRYVLIFHEPIDTAQVESIMLVTSWGTAENNSHANAWMLENGYTVIPIPGEDGRIEQWHTALEISLR